MTIGAGIDAFNQTANFIHKVWAPRTLLTNGGYTRETGLKTAEETPNCVIAYGMPFLANVSRGFARVRSRGED